MLVTIFPSESDMFEGVMHDDNQTSVFYLLTTLAEMTDGDDIQSLLDGEEITFELSDPQKVVPAVYPDDPEYREYQEYLRLKEKFEQPQFTSEQIWEFRMLHGFDPRE